MIRAAAERGCRMGKAAVQPQLTMLFDWFFSPTGFMPVFLTPQKIPNLTVLAAQPLRTILSALFAVPIRTGYSNDRSYGFLLSLENRARWSSIEGHFCDRVSQKVLNIGDFSSHRLLFLSF